MTAEAETLVVLLTPEGRGAIASLLVDGPRATERVAAHFHATGSVPLEHRAIGQIAAGRWGGADGEEVVVCRRNPRQVEVHCHGGLAAAGAIAERLVASGCRQTAWQDWLAQGGRDPIEVAALGALAEAQTERTAAVLFDQYTGALGAAVDKVLAALMANDVDGAAQRIDELLQYADLGCHLVKPWRVVLAGRPNVGKSSLINALVGYRRSIVFDQPGTTRDVLTATTALDGWPVDLVDTAGLYAGDAPTAPDALEAAGVRRAEEQLAAADLVVLVVDAREQGGEDEGWLGSGRPKVLWVANKSDLLVAGEAEVDMRSALSTSALTGEGISELATAIAKRLVPSAPPAGAAVPFTSEQIESLRAARSALAAGERDRSVVRLQSLGRRARPVH